MKSPNALLEMTDGTLRSLHEGGAPIRFECPGCDARHERGFVNGVDRFRCLGCGYSGYGFHTDPEIDRAVYDEWLAINALHRSLGLPDVPQGVDPLNGPG